MVDGDKVINHLAFRYADKIAQYEKEIAFLLVENEELRNEIATLKGKNPSN